MTPVNYSDVKVQYCTGRPGDLKGTIALGVNNRPQLCVADYDGHSVIWTPLDSVHGLPVNPVLIPIDIKISVTLVYPVEYERYYGPYLRNSLEANRFGLAVPPQGFQKLQFPIKEYNIAYECTNTTSLIINGNNTDKYSSSIRVRAGSKTIFSGLGPSGTFYKEIIAPSAELTPKPLLSK